MFNIWDRWMGKRKNALIHPSHRHKSTRVKDANSLELQTPAGWGTSRQNLKLDHRKSDQRGDPREIPAAARAASWSRAKVAAGDARSYRSNSRRTGRKFPGAAGKYKKAAANSAFPCCTQRWKGKQLIRRYALQSPPSVARRTVLPCSLSPKVNSQHQCPDAHLPRASFAASSPNFWRFDPKRIWCWTTAAKSFELRSFCLILQLQCTRIQYTTQDIPRYQNFSFSCLSQ